MPPTLFFQGAAAFALLCFLPTLRGALPDILDTCCDVGREWFTRSRMRCSPYTASVASVSRADEGKCRSIIEVCCLKSRREDQCKLGKDLARLRNTCAGLHNRLGNEQKRECCQCCSLGLIAKAARLPCNLMSRYGPQCGDAFTECCEGTVSRTTEAPTATTPESTAAAGNFSTVPTLIPIINDDMDECSKFPGQLCDHICLNTPGSYRCACHDGFFLKSDERTCQQAVQDRSDRCAENNPCAHQCVDTGSAVTCRCFDGFMLDVDGRSCNDVDECVVGTHSCQRNQVCVNVVGSFKCETRRGPGHSESRCITGYGYNQLTRECQDIDECQVSLHTCRSADQECVNTIGSYTCRNKLLTTNCPAGYDYNRISQKCEDVNECALNQDACLVGQYCENTIGSYTCRRSISCGTGYTLDRQTQQCLDDDECQIGTHNCGRSYECRNTPGSFRCVAKRCPDSYKLDTATGQCKKVVCPRGMRPDRGGNCIDVNECRESPTACRPNQDCTNTVGSYTCRNRVNCGPGFEMNAAGTNCIDVDECARGTHDCLGDLAQCVNRRGNYLCQCPDGYQMDSRSKTCRDIDECTQFGGTVCATNSDCVNSEGSFRCSCKAGFKSTDGGNTCIDEDECLSPGICQHKCRNTWGSFVCSCYTGYKVAADGRTCEDIDECSLWSERGGRLCVGVCTNTPGSYTCGCPDGYRMLGDGRTCQDLDECALGTANCNGPNDFCINTRGEYKCETVECPKGFVRAPSLGSRNNIPSEPYQFSLRRDRVPVARQAQIIRSFHIEDVGIVCQRLDCRASDVACVLNKTKSIQWQFLSLPSIPFVPNPMVLLNVKPIGYSVYPNVVFTIEEGNSERHFDIQTQESTGNTGLLRLLKPIFGPRSYTLRLRMDNKNVYGTVITVHNAIVTIHVSDNNF